MSTDLPVDGSGPVVGRDDMRALMATFPTGVCVVTAVDAEGRPRGMTCSSVSSVALDPATLLVCLRAGSPTLAAVVESRSFAVNFLHEDAEATARLFGSAGSDRFGLVPWRLRAGAPALTADAHSVAQCRLAGRVDVGDHAVVLGAVGDLETLREARPLLYGMRRFGRWPA